MKIKPYLVVYNNTIKSQLAGIESDHFNRVYFEEPELDKSVISSIINQTNKSTPIIIIDGKVNLPRFWSERLLETLSRPETLLCSALSCHVNSLSPLAANDEFNGTSLDLDNLIYLLQEATLIHTNQINYQCFIVKENTVLDKLDSIPNVACSNLLVQSSNTKKLASTDLIDIGNQKPLPAHALADLHWQLKGHLKEGHNIQEYPVLDKKPIILHIAMDWGGGVHKWINDYCKHDKNHHHLILQSHGELYRHRHGERLSLSFYSSKNLIIKSFELQAPIKATCIEHPEYKLILKKLVEQFQVQHIIVSSLIGHSMECLNTGLKTIRVLHDYFPSWPSLMANLENDTIDEIDIQKALKLTENEPFGRITSIEYQQWKEHLHKCYQSEEVKLVAPSQSVLNNLIKIDPTSFKQLTIIPHAIDKLKPLNYSSPSRSFQILILGRINPPKGQQLLEEIMNELLNDCVFVLIGAGNEGKKYLNIKNIKVIMEYDNSELQQVLDETSPDLALITSQTSETFNYTLSELQQAGICTLSTKFGALKERIIDGKTGYLCENNSQSIVETIRFLRQNPNKIISIREQLKKIIPQILKDEIRQYQGLLHSQRQCSYKLAAESGTSTLWAKKLLHFNQQKIQLTQSLLETEKTLDERTQWAQKLAKEITVSHTNIALEREDAKRLKQLLKSETNRMTKEIESINHVLQDETTRMQSEISKLNNNFQALYGQYETSLREKQTMEKEKQIVQRELNDVYTSRSWRVTKPMRKFTTWARHKRNAIKFRLSQLRSFPSRAIRSLKTRGLSGTLSVIKAKVNKPQAQITEQKTVEVTHDFDPIAFTKSNSPCVSIIIPVYNHYKHTYNCLKSIAELQDETSFEIIVIDDCSTDDTEELIKNISGITYLRQKQNGGFIESCNTGARVAKGEYLMFLNNDTVVYANWLDALLDVFKLYPDAGLVGSKLVYPNNQLQEAGGIIFSDASGWNYGRLGIVDEPSFNHVREVDYCSGASILIPNALFKQLGCFDERYKPAYYEDTDLAFAVRQSGKKVYYQPASLITHFEGISSGTDLNAGMKKYQVVNQTKFKEKWADQLKKHQKSGTDIELCRIHGNPKRILIFDACTPTPDQDAGSLRMLNLIKILKQLHYHVVFMPENLSHNKSYTTTLQQLGVECIYTPHISNPVDYLKQKGGYLDVVLLSRYYVAEPVMPFIREYCPKAQIIFDTVDLHHVRERRMAEIHHDKKLAKMAEMTRVKELEVAKSCDVTLVVSPYEVEVLAQELPETKVKVLTTIHEIYGCRKPFEQRKDILFIGGYQHTPNVDAIEWFVAEIFPLIEIRLPALKFHIVGSKAPKHIVEMARDNIIFQGFVEDIEPLMDDIRIAIAPLRYGSGVKGKVNMSMSYGQPVVGTKVAVEGMHAQEGVDVLMAETPQEFANQIIRLYEDEELWNTISQGGLQNVQNYFSFDAAKKALKAILN